MHIHIIGICGTFMGGVAAIANELGNKVTGSDANVYPPMSTHLESIGVNIQTSYSADNLKSKPDLVIIGNALSRGNLEVEAVLDLGIKYTSGAQWLADYVLVDKCVLAVSGTHGKTTTSAMLAWILECADLSTGFLVGGVLQNFGVSARLGNSPFFVVEADEYDTAFFDKRSKFVHYRPKTLLINNLEFDHADIFEDLESIKTQFHHLVRTVPSQGLIIYPENNSDIKDVLGGWTATETIGNTWKSKLLQDDGSEFEIIFNSEVVGAVSWQLIGKHNVDNALGAIACAKSVGVSIDDCTKALASFKTTKRRMELIGDINSIKVYDDFAHHPTAIMTTLAGLRTKVKHKKIIAILEPRSNTMKMGVHKHTLRNSLQDADLVYIYQNDAIDWSIADSMSESINEIKIFTSISNILDDLLKTVQADDSIVIMSNGSFENIHQILLDKLNEQ